MLFRSANKVDVAGDTSGVAAELATVAAGAPVHMIGARGGLGMADLERYFDGNRTIVLIGSSGVGKSTMINQFLGRAAQETQDVRGHDSRGRHTTTHRQLFLRPLGGSIIDTPGMRGLEVWSASEASAPDFSDIDGLAAQCKFRNCGHRSEPGCAVRGAIAGGRLEAERLAAYLNSKR